MKKFYFLAPVLFMILILFSQCKKEENNTCNWTTVFFDDFQRANGTIGTNYSVQVSSGGNGQAEIHNGKLRFYGSGFWAIRYSIPINSDRLKISVKYTPVYGSASCGVAGKGMDLGGNFSSQEFYGGFANAGGFGIYRCQGTTPVQLISGSLGFTLNHTYLIELIIDNKDLLMNMKDLSSSESSSVSITDSENMLTGDLVSMNGANSLTDTLEFDDFKIEVCN